MTATPKTVLVTGASTDGIQVFAGLRDAGSAPTGPTGQVTRCSSASPTPADPRCALRPGDRLAHRGIVFQAPPRVPRDTGLVQDNSEETKT
jgi:hypothetical protein